MVPPPGLVLGRVAVDRDRKVVAEVRFRKGHMARDCWRRDSMGSRRNCESKGRMQQEQSEKRARRDGWENGRRDILWRLSEEGKIDLDQLSVAWNMFIAG